MSPRRFSLLLALVCLLSSCASRNTADPVIRHHGNFLQWGVVGIPDVPTLDPALASDPTSISVASLIYGGLVRLDRHLRVRPDGASRWTVSGGGTVYTFYLRHNLRFADGTRVTATDFADALQRALGPEGGAGTASFYLGLITHHSSIFQGGTKTTRGITVVNPTTLRITLAHPAAHFLAELAFPASYVPEPALLSRYGSSWTDHAAGFGPFSVQVWRHSRYLTMVRNRYYYGGLPRLKRISLHFYAGQQSAIAAYQANRLDIISGLQPGQQLVQDPPGVAATPALALDYLAFNTTRPPFKNLNVRRAFAAIDPAKLAARSMKRSAFPAHGFLPSAFGITTASVASSRASSHYLALAHFPHGAHFPRVTLVMQRDPTVYALASKLAEAWHQSLKVEVDIRQLNSSNYATVLDAHAFDLAIVRWGADYPDPQDYLGTQLGSSPNNITGWQQKTYDRDLLLADSYNPLDPRRVVLYQQAARIAARQVPIVPLDEPTLTGIIRPGLQGVSMTGLGTIAGNWARARFTG